MNKYGKKMNKDMKKMNKEISILKDFASELDDKVECILKINQDLPSCIATILGAYVCKMVVDRFGKTEKAQEILNQTMQKSWESVTYAHDKEKYKRDI
jgi:cell division protein ZapA (FtsZ GTPase activity inhibitor)